MKHEHIAKILEACGSNWMLIGLDLPHSGSSTVAIRNRNVTTIGMTINVGAAHRLPEVVKIIAALPTFLHPEDV